MKNLLVTNLVVSILTLLGVGYMLTFGVPLGTGGEELQTALIVGEKEGVEEAVRIPPAAERQQVERIAIAGTEVLVKYHLNYEIVGGAIILVGVDVDEFKVPGERSEVHALLGQEVGITAEEAAARYLAFMGEALRFIHDRAVEFAMGFEISAHPSRFDMRFSVSDVTEVTGFYVGEADGQLALLQYDNFVSDQGYIVDYYGFRDGRIEVIAEPLPILVGPISEEPILKPIGEVGFPLAEAGVEVAIPIVFSGVAGEIPATPLWEAKGDRAYHIVGWNLGDPIFDWAKRDEFLIQMGLFNTTSVTDSAPLDALVDAIAEALKAKAGELVTMYSGKGAVTQTGAQWAHFPEVATLAVGSTVFRFDTVRDILRRLESTDDLIQVYPPYQFDLNRERGWLEVPDRRVTVEWVGTAAVAAMYGPRMSELTVEGEMYNMYWDPVIEVVEGRTLLAGARVSHIGYAGDLPALKGAIGIISGGQIGYDKYALICAAMQRHMLEQIQAFAALNRLELAGSLTLDLIHHPHLTMADTDKDWLIVSTDFKDGQDVVIEHTDYTTVRPQATLDLANYSVGSYLGATWFFRAMAPIMQ